ncbi:MAG: hypothetical protein MI862_01670 [Desulfobacterales bacterium]|nr:hypothetical protein [Desulfobacterales bacterium]
MAKNVRLIPGENNNWEVASFLLIDHLYSSNSIISHIQFSRKDMHSSINALNFIENLLGPIGYVVNRTLSNSISSAITRLEREGYIDCYDGECILTKKGIKKLQEITEKYAETKEEPIGLNKMVFKALESLDPETRKTVLKKYYESAAK